MEINKEGRLCIGGCDAVLLAETFGTPLYVIDEKVVRERCRAYLEGFRRTYPNSRVVYAGKALLTTAICRIVEDEGLALDVVSGGELYTALAADFPVDRIYFHGNNKSIDELDMALRAGVHRIVVDNLYELDLLSQMAAGRGVTASVLIRVTPGVEAHTHSYIQTGQVDSKFGFGTESGAALEAARAALNKPNVKLEGFHCHIGSQIFDVSSYEAAGRAMFDFLESVKDALGYVAAELNLGGGLGIRYTAGDVKMNPADFSAWLGSFVKEEAAKRGYPEPLLLIEPGRSIVGEAGTTLYTIGATKEIPGIRTYVSVDGGMSDNPRVALYQAKYEAIVANRASEAPALTVSVAGKCCESGDMLIWDLKVPQYRPGDVLAVFSTGAYNYSMASNYNRLPRPAMVLVCDGKADLIVQRETYEDLVRLDTMPSRLERARQAVC